MGRAGRSGSRKVPYEDGNGIVVDDRRGFGEGKKCNQESMHNLCESF